MISSFRMLRRKIAFEMRLTYYTFCHNECMDTNYALETCTEPMYRFVDRFAKVLGPIFVFLVSVLISIVVGLFYTYVLPYKLEHSSPSAITAYLIIGHWLLINIVYHYVRAVITPPGSPPSVVPESASICRKCIGPKPPRTHHCSVCKTCVLKMDHHCPWVNNCVGHGNHRYFFLFMAFMWLGVLYVCAASFDQFAYHSWGEEGLLHIFAPVFRFLISGETFGIARKNASGAESKGDPAGPPPVHVALVPEITAESAQLKFAIFFEFVLCVAVLLALGILLGYHIMLVNKGETTIETHINAKEKDRQAKRNMVYRNPYNLGLWANWRLFLGLEQGRTFWRHVLLPSGHAPVENGLQWRTIYDPSNGTKLL